MYSCASILVAPCLAPIRMTPELTQGLFIASVSLREGDEETTARTIKIRGYEQQLSSINKFWF